MIQTPPQKYNPKEVEDTIQQFWKKHKVMQQSIIQRKGCRPYIFLEGPPTANGLPHPGHVLTRVMKDLILRYYTMQGYYILRKAGWDTHGLPVEIEVEKKLGLEDKQAIERYGVAEFNEECKKSVFKYEQAWVDLTQRIGFWVDMENPYITLKNEYIESVWWSLKQAYEKKLLYKGHKVVPYCPRCGTALSAHELSQGYKTVEDPSIFVKFKLKHEDAFFLAWTTTPWTLISNVALAVHPHETYIKIRYRDEVLILAQERAATLMKGEAYEILDQCSGEELEHTEYEPLFTYTSVSAKAWYVVLADFVTMSDGTGIVHIAPGFGEDDYAVGSKYNLPVVQLVNPDGTFKDEVIPWKGQFVKDADPHIIRYLAERGVLAGTKTYTHDYPFCWRCDSPLLYYAMESWFIAMTKIQDSLIRNNNAIKWYPEHLQQGRFGDFIRDVKDWALSRDRYWGTPLPIWICSNARCAHTVCIGSVEELRTLSATFPKQYDLHKPFVDELVVHCPKCHTRMKREKEVIDCWYDSGSAFFAQWHYPFEHTEEFQHNYPVDFICEALDQTRGWFYSLLAISTFLFDKHPYKTVLTLGLVLDKDNQKMSKSKQNYVDPNVILDHEGADALRWYLISANAPWMSTRFYEDAVRETLGKFILTFWNSYNFFATYAALDRFDPRKEYVPCSERELLDQWIVSRFNHVVSEVQTYISKFEIHKAARTIESFIIDDFSNWYLRRSRKRLWVEHPTKDKRAAYSTMYDIILNISKSAAPFIPFITEEIYQNLRMQDEPISIHLCDYPCVDVRHIHDELEQGMKRIRDLVEVGRALRSKIGVNVRYPLMSASIVCAQEQEEMITPLLDLLNEEINVKKISFRRDVREFMDEHIQINTPHVGKKYKEKAKKIISCLTHQDLAAIYKKLKKHTSVSLTVDDETFTFTADDFKVVESVKENYVQGSAHDMILFLETTRSDELEAEGFARELIRRIQSMRKELNLAVEDRIHIQISLSKGKKQALQPWLTHITQETRAEKLDFCPNPQGSLLKKWDIDNELVCLAITK